MSHNVFADMGLPNPEEELTKARLVLLLGKVIEEKGLTQEQAAQQLEIKTVALADLLDGVWDNYSTSDLFRFANALGRNVRITIDSQDAAPEASPAHSLAANALP